MVLVIVDVAHGSLLSNGLPLESESLGRLELREHMVDALHDPLDEALVCGHKVLAFEIAL